MDPQALIWTMTNAGVSARSLQVVATLGVADLLDELPVAAEELARRCDVDPDALDRVLQLLVAHGIFTREPIGYSHTDASRLLRTDHPASMRALAQMMDLPVFTAALADLGHSIRTGRPSVLLTDPDGMWSHLDRNPDAQRLFTQAMTAKSAGDTGAVLDAYPFPAGGRVVDVGGGRGHLLHAVLQATPGTDGILFDLPDVVESGGPSHPRLIRRAGDFFIDPLPTGDHYLLMEVIHDWPDADAVQILKAVRKAAAPGARILVIESILRTELLDLRGHTLDVIMLAFTGGRERTVDELAGLLDAAGLRLERVIETATPLRIAEAVHPADARDHSVETPERSRQTSPGVVLDVTR
jgi:C-methyltransferase